ncbi:hypothetical protein LC724_15375 [Blautia sp. RD014234]|nr:hypothetical protein [Blautia parvula]
MRSNVKNVIETEDCVVLQIFDESGEGTMTAHKIFDGAFVMYSDMHLKECVSHFQSSTGSSLLYIDHCREGRIENEIGNHAYGYLQEHEMRVDNRRFHSGRVCFPLCHYHGMTLGFDLEIAVPALRDFLAGFRLIYMNFKRSIVTTRNRLLFIMSRELNIFFQNFTLSRSKSKETTIK